MHFLFDNPIVNGEVVPARDLNRDGSPQPDSHEDDTATDCSDVGDLSEFENEDDKGGMIEMFRKIHPREEFAFPFQSTHTPKTSLNEEEDDPPAKSKGKEKEREKTATPEPQHQAQEVDHTTADLLRFLIGNHLEATERKHRYSPYASIDEPRVKSIRGPPTEHEDFGDSDFVSPKWYRRRDMFASRFRPRSRRPLPEFVTGPSRITLDDLYYQVSYR